MTNNINLYIYLFLFIQMKGRDKHIYYIIQVYKHLCLNIYN